MSGFLKVTMRGAEKITAFLQTIPGGAKKVGMAELLKYLVGSGSHGLKHYPPPLPSRYVRTYMLRSGWYSNPGDGSNSYIGNPVPYAPFVQGQPPARHMIRRGWRGHMDVIFSNLTGAVRMAQFAVNRWIKSLQ